MKGNKLWIAVLILVMVTAVAIPVAQAINLGSIIKVAGIGLSVPSSIALSTR